ncbi:MAG: dynamin family protein [Rhodobacteraceae bacterium]|nr:dynamin family protein [Paracoccaceae bacterium]
MNMTSHIEPDGGPAPLAQTMPPSPFQGLDGLAAEFHRLRESVGDFPEAGHGAMAARAKRVFKKLEEFEPKVTFIGQVKAGKTTLLNALIGQGDVLPTDINPWTSVVTSVHLGPKRADRGQGCTFRFFSNDEWENLVRHGGRLGEMANRAGASSEIEKVRSQLDQMREKSRCRLGDRFELLLGQTHRYDTFSPELVRRYVCLGDDFAGAEGEGEKQGHFADITKAADIWLNDDAFAVPLCLQDTPGINDTFLVREQITLNGLRGSNVCVVVLSAQQALSTVDLGLIRLVSSVQARGIVIFVNRIDELADPTNDVPKIRKGIVDTLARFGGPQDAEIIFGSANWALSAMAENFNNLSEASTKTLLDWASAHIDDDLVAATPQQVVWSMSGVPQLGAALTRRIEEGAARQLLERAETSLKNMNATGTLFRADDTGSGAGAVSSAVATPELAAEVAQLKARCAETLDADLAKATEAFDRRVESSVRTFVSRALTDMAEHIQANSSDKVWSYDPAGLRILLRGSYQSFVSTAGRAAERQMAEAADALSQLLAQASGQEGQSIELLPEPIPPAPAAVELGSVIALDLKGSWWTRFWRKRNPEAYAEDFASLLEEEARGLVAQLRSECVAPYTDALRRKPSEFLADQLHGVVPTEPASVAAAPAAQPDGPVHPRRVRRRPMLREHHT